MNWDLSRRRSHRTSSLRRTTRNRFRPAVRALEDRQLLSTFTWVSNSSGNFNDPANWQNQQGQPGVPGAGDAAIINVAGITVTSPTTVTIDNLQSVATLALTGGTFTVDDSAANSTIANLTIANGATFDVSGGTATVTNGGIFAGAVSIAAGSTFSLTGGTVNVNTGTAFAGSGVFSIAGGTLTINDDVDGPSNLVLNSGQINGSDDLTLPGLFTWAGGTLGGTGTTTIPNGATLTINGSNEKTINGGHILNIVGTATWSGSGNIAATDDPIIQNFGTFSIQQAEQFSGAGSFDNNGTLNVAAGTLVSIFGGGAQLNNGGTVNVTSGTFRLDSGGFNTATINLSANTVLDFDGGTFQVSGSPSLSGTGVYQLEAGTLTVNANVSVAKLNISGGTLNGTGTVTVTGTANWTDGDIDGGGTLTIPAGGTLNISSSSDKSLKGGHVLNNAGTATWSGTGLLQTDGDAAVNNSGTFNINGGQFYSGASAFNNSGTLNVSAGSDTAEFANGAVLNNTGTLNVKSGKLKLEDGGSDSGTTNVSAGATLSFDGGTFLVTGTPTFPGLGTLSLAAGTLTFNTNATVSTLDVNAGTLNGSGTVTVSAVLNWLGGALDGSGTMTVGTNGVLNINGSETKQLSNGHTLNSGGTATWAGSGAIEMSNDANLVNTGTFTIEGGLILSGAGTFRNKATLIVQAGTGTAMVTNSALFNNPGTVNVQSGIFEVDNGGVMSGTVMTATNSIFNLNGGTSTISGTATNIQGTGTFSFTGGTITTPAAGGTLTVAQGVAFVWSGGQFVIPTNATLTYKGTMTVAGTANTIMAGAGTFSLAGTVNQIGSGNLELDGATSGTTRTKLTIQSGSAYRFGSDSGIVNGAGAGGLITNSGTIAKTGGTGTSTIATNMNSTASIMVNVGTIALALTGGTMNGGQFTVAVSSALDLTGGQTVNYSGTFTGSGTGQVQLNSGTLNVSGGSAGASFSFPAGLFLWNGGTINTNASSLNIPASGRMQIAGIAGQTLSGTGALNVSGIVTQTGTGNLLLSGTTLRVQSGGQYNIQSNSGIQPNGGANSLVAVNSGGTLNKTAGSGITTITTPVNNNGVIQASSGTLKLTGAISQVSGTTLNGGRWIALGTPTITSVLMIGSNVFNTIGIQARVTLNGPNSSITNLTGLNTVNGNFFLVGGQSFSTNSLTNNGTLTIGPGSVLHVAGNFTQTSSATYVNRLGGTNTSPKMGAITATGTVKIAGGLAIENSSNIRPIVGSSFTIIVNQGTSAIQGIFNGLPQGTPINVNGMLFTIAYNAGPNRRNVGLTRTM